jgi:hypothetical protein
MTVAVASLALSAALRIGRPRGCAESSGILAVSPPISISTCSGACGRCAPKGVDRQFPLAKVRAVRGSPAASGAGFRARWRASRRRRSMTSAAVASSMARCGRHVRRASAPGSGPCDAVGSRCLSEDEGSTEIEGARAASPTSRHRRARPHLATVACSSAHPSLGLFPRHTGRTAGARVRRGAGRCRRQALRWAQPLREPPRRLARFLREQETVRFRCQRPDSSPG